MTGGPFRHALPTVALMFALASCSHGSSHGAGSSPSTTAPRPPVLVTIGSDATFGNVLYALTDSWPQKFYHEAFPQSTVLVNAAERPVTLDRAAVLQLPLALQEHATVVAVWLGDADLAANFPASAFKANLNSLVKELRDSGARVLLGNMSRERPGAAAYDDAIASVARARGATLVDLATALSATPDIGPSSAVKPTTSTQIADAFAAALAGS
jgi:hypothetical protein